MVCGRWHCGSHCRWPVVSYAKEEKICTKKLLDKLIRWKRGSKVVFEGEGERRGEERIEMREERKEKREQE